MILVDYACRECGMSTEHWLRQPVPSARPCACGATAHRRYGVALLSGRTDTQHAAHAGTAHDHHDAVPGSCTLTPTAARMLSARARGDNRAIEREIASQESAIKTGTLDPSRPPTTDYPGQRLDRGAS